MPNVVRYTEDVPPVALTQCPATTSNNGDEVTISGLFNVEEYWPYEPSAYVYSSFYRVSRVDGPTDPEAPMFDVDADEFFKQTDPNGYARTQEYERQMMMEQERRDLDDRFGRSI